MSEAKSFVAGFVVGASSVLVNRKDMDVAFNDHLAKGNLEVRPVLKCYGKLFITSVAAGAAVSPVVTNRVTCALGGYMGACCALLPVIAGAFRPKAMSLDDVARKAAMDF